VAEPIHLRPTAPLAQRVILPGDPGRALLLAQELIDGPRMFNHHRGLWGYSGTAHDGEPLTIQSTGMGGPSAAIVIHELLDLGADRLLRLGTCGSLDPLLDLGEAIVAGEALAADGTSQALGAGNRVAADPALLGALAGAGARRTGVVVSTDLFYDESPERVHTWQRDGALAVEMETATLLTLARRRGVAAAALLIVSDLLLPARARLEDDALADAARRAGHLALRALA
jgi:uridine phosphorylase